MQFSTLRSCEFYIRNSFVHPTINQAIKSHKSCVTRGNRETCRAKSETRARQDDFPR